MKLKKLLTIAFIGILSLSQAQEIQDSSPRENTTSENSFIQDSIQLDYKVKRLSIGLKVGIPNIASVGAQYTTPF